MKADINSQSGLDTLVIESSALIIYAAQFGQVSVEPEARPISHSHAIIVIKRLH
jgi:hypothetical protein